MLMLSYLSKNGQFIGSRNILREPFYAFSFHGHDGIFIDADEENDSVFESFSCLSKRG